MRKVLFILGQMSDMDVDWLSRAGSVEKLKAGTILIEEGKYIDSLYILLEGTIVVFTGKQSYRELARLKSGEIIGEMSFIDSSPTSASVKSEEDSLVLRISRTTLGAKLEEDPRFSSRFYRAIAMFLSDRLRKQMAKNLDHATEESKGEGALEEDELDLNVLDSVSLAGSRFDRLLKKLRGHQEPVRG